MNTLSVLDLSLLVLGWYVESSRRRGREEMFGGDWSP